MSDLARSLRRAPGAAVAPPPDRLPRLLQHDPAGGATTLVSHLDRYGDLPPLTSRQQRRHLVEEVAGAGLTGRGGAGFPTARKLAAVSAGRRPVVVANGTEAEPASAKDKVLLAQSPHLVLDGAVVAAEAVGASRAIVVVHPSVRGIVDDAVAERRSAARSGRAVWTRAAGARDVQIDVVTGADRFVGGEASAVVHWIERGVPVPTRTPPRLSERGLGGRPTLVQNVETLAHLALIARYGASWFRGVGAPGQPGSMLVTILGGSHRPCVREIATGTRLERVLDLADVGAGRPQALLLGGYFGTWVPGGAVDLPFSAEGLAPVGASVGAGLVAALPDGACGLAETARVTRYLADESAGQCGPCLFGLDAIAGELQRLVDGDVRDVTRLRRWLGEVERRGACSHPDGVVRMVRSGLTVFAAELEQHAQGRCSAGGAAGLLPVPARRRR